MHIVLLLQSSSTSTTSFIKYENTLLLLTQSNLLRTFTKIPLWFQFSCTQVSVYHRVTQTTEPINNYLFTLSLFSLSLSVLASFSFLRCHTSYLLNFFKSPFFFLVWVSCFFLFRSYLSLRFDSSSFQFANQPTLRKRKPHLGLAFFLVSMLPFSDSE